MNTGYSNWVDRQLGRMTLDQKIGQLMVFGFCGPVITPDVIELIQKYHVGGLRISQKFRMMTLAHDLKPGTVPTPAVKRSLHLPAGRHRDFAYHSRPVHCTAAEYAATLNRLREAALDRPLGIPLHLTIDQEGSASDDLLSGQRLFPHPMGYAAAGDPDLAYRSALCVGRQARALGVNMIHSPVLDVNTNPDNPEIGTRAYSDDPQTVARFAVQTMKGLQAAGLVTTGKHFPGRGDSACDAHWSLPTVETDAETLRRVHLEPYRTLIAAGLDAVMIANSSYPALGVSDRPAVVDSGIVTDLLRGELGFEGVITTDNMMMGGVLERFEISDAAVRCLQAGCDLILLRDESPLRLSVIDAVRDAVADGRLTEARIDASVQRILKMRWKMGLLADGGRVDAAHAGRLFNDPDVVRTATEAADRTVLCLRDKDRLLPLDPAQKVLLVEQIFPTHAFANDMYSHPGLLWEQMCRISAAVGSVEIPFAPHAADTARVLRRIPEADVLVMTNYYYHKAASSVSDLIRKAQAFGKPVIVVSNTPYAFGAPKDFPSVVVCFNPGAPEHLAAVARMLYAKPERTLQSPPVGANAAADVVLLNKS